MSKIVITFEGDTIEQIRAEMEDMLGRIGGEVTTQAADPVAPAAPVKTVEAPDGVLVAENGTTTEVTREADEADDAATDSDGMPYNPDVHSGTRALNADGTWKAMRGKKKEADAARAAFKAGGAKVDAPETGGLPGADTKTVDLPGAENLPTGDPVSLEDVVKAANDALTDEVITQAELVQMYVDVTGAADAKSAFAIFQTNETKRGELAAAINARYE